MKIRCIFAVVVGLALLPSARSPAADQVPAGAADILSPESCWRWFLTLRKPVIPVEALKAAGQDASAPKPLTGRVVPPPYDEVDQQDSPPPPAGWDAPDFDDFDWPRSRLTWLAPNAFGRFSSAILCLRGKFQVTDPAEVEGLYLTVKYYGGVRILLNGREIARQHLQAGALPADAPAAMYPKDVYVDDKSVIVPFGDHEYSWSSIQGEQKKDAEVRRASRTRVLGPVKIPVEALRKGTNLLTVEVRRSEYPYEALRWFKPQEGRTKPFWKPINLLDVRLQAAGGGATPNVRRPAGVQVWTENTNDRITPLDYGDAGEGLRPMRIVGARNGSFCGQLAIGSDRTFKSPRVNVGDFKRTTGSGVIPASNVTVLHALPNVSYYGMPAWFDALQPEPPAEVAVARGGGAVLPVLLRVKVPRDSRPGDYRGEAVVTVDGAEAARVPVEMNVAAWTVPEPKNYRTYVGVYQSPTSVALQYKVPEWSEEHWKLMEKSFALLARAGNRLVNVPVVDQTQFGNEDGMVYWLRKPDGGFAYDFSVFDRYMDLVQKCLNLDYVALHVWHSGGWDTRKDDQENTVTVVDGKTGARTHMQVPAFGTAESKTFWKPVLDAAQERLAKRGLEKAMILGILSDGTASPEVFKAFNEIAPGGARWMRGCHHGTYSEKPDALPGGGVTVLHEFCYGTPLDKALPAQPYHRQRWWPGTDYERIGGHESATALTWYRETGITSLMRRTRGVGRICLDFWDVLGTPRSAGDTLSSGRDIYNRWPRSSCAQREPSLKRMTWPGPDGAATTLRYEAFCEGIQFAEALVVVSEALDVKAADLGPEKVAACRRLLTDLWCREVRGGWGSPLRPDHEGWQTAMRQLFEAAGEVSGLQTPQ